MVVCERAKLATGVRFSSTAPFVSTHIEPDLWRGAWSAKPRLRVRFPAGSPGLRGARRPSGRRAPPGSRTIRALCSHQLAARLPDSRSFRWVCSLAVLAARARSPRSARRPSRRVPLGTPPIAVCHLVWQAATLSLSCGTGQRATNAVYEVRLLAGRPAPAVTGSSHGPAAAATGPGWGPPTSDFRKRREPPKLVGPGSTPGRGTAKWLRGEPARCFSARLQLDS